MKYSLLLVLMMLPGCAVGPQIPVVTPVSHITVTMVNEGDGGTISGSVTILGMAVAKPVTDATGANTDFRPETNTDVHTGDSEEPVSERTEEQPAEQ